jgi:hypothetical protein
MDGTLASSNAISAFDKVIDDALAVVLKLREALNGQDVDAPIDDFVVLPVLIPVLGKEAVSQSVPKGIQPVDRVAIFFRNWLKVMDDTHLPEKI